MSDHSVRIYLKTGEGWGFPPSKDVWGGALISESTIVKPPWIEYGFENPDQVEMPASFEFGGKTQSGAALAEGLSQVLADSSQEYESSQVRSRVRVRELAEVFTNRREVHAMLDTVGDALSSLDAKVLEPAAGNGNFLVAILERKLKCVYEINFASQSHFEHRLLRALASVYGIDISEENVIEARARMAYSLMLQVDVAGSKADLTDGFLLAAALILQANIVAGDTIGRGQEIELCEWVPTSRGRFQRRWSPALVPPAQRDLFWSENIQDPEPIHYSKLAPKDFEHGISELKSG